MEVIDLAEHMGFNLGNVLKYLLRAPHKHTDGGKQDYNKTLWYVEREIQRRLHEEYQPEVVHIPLEAHDHAAKLVEHEPDRGMKDALYCLWQAVLEPERENVGWLVVLKYSIEDARIEKEPGKST